MATNKTKRSTSRGASIVRFDLNVFMNLTSRGSFFARLPVEHAETPSSLAFHPFSFIVTLENGLSIILNRNKRVRYYFPYNVCINGFVFIRNN